MVRTGQQIENVCVSDAIREFIHLRYQRSLNTTTRIHTACLVAILSTIQHILCESCHLRCFPLRLDVVRAAEHANTPSSSSSSNIECAQSRHAFQCAISLFYSSSSSDPSESSESSESLSFPSLTLQSAAVFAEANTGVFDRRTSECSLPSTGSPTVP